MIVHESLHILNGLGTRGVMLGPALAKDLYDYIENQIPIPKKPTLRDFIKDT